MARSVSAYLGAFATVVLLAFQTSAIAREPAQRAEFIRQNPCPVTGSAKPHHSCPGWVVDHVVPLCAGGQDAPVNMQWQELAASKVKDKEEWHTCRLLKKQAVDTSAK